MKIENCKLNFQDALENLYISPLELCNLACKVCYTNKTKSILSNDKILDFVERYQKVVDLKSILFCGGEVFTLKEFPVLINTLIQKDLFISIITNGTVDRIDEITNPNSVQLLVSLDGPKEVHDANRGVGNFDKSIAFIKKAMSLGFHVEIFYLITKDSYPYRDSLDVFGLPKTYLTDRLMSLSHEQLLDIKTNYPTYPRKDFGCFQLALQSNGLIYGCCESPTPLAKMTDDPSTIIKNFTASLNTCNQCGQCKGCCDPNYLCGYKKELQLLTCQEVVKSFHDKA